MDSSEKLSERIKGRQMAQVVIDLVRWEAQKLPQNAKDTFWEEIREIVLFEAPLPVDNLSKTAMKAKPMNDQEAKEFEKEEIPFGHLKGERVGNVPLDYLQWLGSQIFLDQLRSYLLNDTISRSTKG